MFRVVKSRRFRGLVVVSGGLRNAQSALERESEASARRIGKEVQSVSLETPKDNNNNSTKVRALSYYCTDTVAMAPKLSPRQPLSARAQCALS